MPYYVRPDLTREELSIQAELNSQRIELRKQKKDVVIYRGEIMERKKRDELRNGSPTKEVQSN